MGKMKKFLKKLQRKWKAILIFVGIVGITFVDDILILTTGSAYFGTRIIPIIMAVTFLMLYLSRKQLKKLWKKVLK